jgi:hypothetical protein
MKRTKKYVAGERLMLKIGGRIPDENADLYAVLERRGYWWDAKSGKWLDTPAPSTSVFKTSHGTPTGVVKIRVMAHPDEVQSALSLLDKAFKVVNVSEQYENRKGPGVRVYVDVLLSGGMK